MTWQEFKKLVEDAGVEDSMEIEYIDIIRINTDRIEVRIDKNRREVAISD